MNAERLIASMERFPDVLVPLVRGLDAADVRFKPRPGDWSILEVLRHLGDEEVDDFRTRLDLTLHQPGTSWPGIDPEGWAGERRYNEDDPDGALHRFVNERVTSIGWLKGLEAPDWNSSYEHPQIGPLRAGDLLASWAAHDQLHLRQIAKRRFEMIQVHAGDFDTAYAGPW